jgi:hypothetical protein
VLHGVAHCCVLLPCRPSPLNLLQESYPDPWQHIICCVLCSRTSGSELIRTAIAAFFQALPTPTAVLEADGELRRVPPAAAQAPVERVSCVFPAVVSVSGSHHGLPPKVVLPRPLCTGLQPRLHQAMSPRHTT